MIFPVLQDDLTPLSLAISERKQQMVEFLAKKEANIHAVDKMQRYRSFSFYKPLCCSKVVTSRLN